ncbi:MAG: DUF3786 domain-containing protein [Thermodesulfobacteriota bacterium]|nr:DUF3786 domain-containing protein [Thermodesulfobacteriota bacterium]
MATASKSVFKETYQYYLDRIQALDLAGLAAPLGVDVSGGEVAVKLFEMVFRISGRGIVDATEKRAPFEVCIMLANYLLQCPDETPSATDWVTYAGLKDSGPLTVFFKQEVERAIASAFAGKVDALKHAGHAIGGRVAETDIACDLAMQFPALPKVLLMLLFNDKDEEFSATSTVLFEQRAESYLDPECLAMLGRYLFTKLNKEK